MHHTLENKKARLEYELLETYEAGIELFGHEAKSLRAGKASLIGAHVMIRGGEAYLVGASISPFIIRSGSSSSRSHWRAGRKNTTSALHSRNAMTSARWNVL
jgi:tmRNA-binding protein